MIIFFKFRYRLSDQTDSDWKTITIPSLGTSFTLYNLQPETEYQFQMFSKNLLGTGLPSPIITATTKHKGKKVHSFKLICYLMLWYDFLIFNIYLQFLLTDVTHVINEW